MGRLKVVDTPGHQPLQSFRQDIRATLLPDARPAQHPLREAAARAYDPGHGLGASGCGNILQSIVEISDPSQSVSLATLALGGTAVDVAIAGEFVLVAASEGGLRVVDVADPAAPIEVGSFDTLGTGTIVVRSWRLCM